jgi:phosphate transport system permease protein
MYRLRTIKDKGARWFMQIMAFSGIIFLVIIGIALLVKAYPVIRDNGLLKLLASGSWRPSGGEFGFLPFIVSTLYVSAIAIAIALPLSLLTAIYLNSYSSRGIRRFFEPVIDLLSGIPPVIYGVWGTITIVPFIANNIAHHFAGPSSGYSVLAGGIVLAVMIIPLLVGLLVEIFNSIPGEMTNASLSLGATKWQTVKRVILRRSLPGIVAVTVLAVTRAFGETMAVLMVCGNSTLMPHSLLDACYPLPALIANNYGEMLSIPGYEAALMLAALMLFVIVFLFNGISRLTLNHIEKRFHF